MIKRKPRPFDKQLIAKLITLFSFGILSITSQAQMLPVPNTPGRFIFSKYQLPDAGAAAMGYSSYLASQTSNKYKIHYKIKTLTFPAEPEKPSFSIVDLFLGNLLPWKEERNNNTYSIPYKQH